MTTVAGGVEGGGGLGDVFTNDGGVGDLGVAECQFVAGPADGARIMSNLGLLQRPSVERDRPGLLAS